MKNGSSYATRLKKAFTRLSRGASRKADEAPADPLRHLAIGILGREDGPAAGEHALHRLFKRMNDWNELRVSTPDELVGMVGGALRHPLPRCADLCNALNALYRRENTVNLDRLFQGKVKDARHYLETLPGMDAHSTACVLLWGLGAHAVPVHDRLLSIMRREGWVDPDAPREEVQSFLERHVKSTDVRQFCRIMNAFADHPSSRPVRGDHERNRRPAKGRVAPKARTAARARKKKGK